MISAVDLGRILSIDVVYINRIPKIDVKAGANTVLLAVGERNN